MAEDLEQRYRADGYLVCRELLDAAELDLVTDAIDALTSAARGAPEAYPFSFDPGRAGDPEGLRRIFSPIDHDQRLAFLFDHPRVLDAASLCVGSDVVFHSAKVVCKPKDSVHTARWHQDLAFFNHSNASVVTLSLHLDDFSDGHGALIFAAGSHADGLLRHARGQVLPPQALRCDARARLMAVGRGEATLHHSLTVHSARINAQATRRRLLMVFRAADAEGLELPPPALYGRFHGRLLRGNPRPARSEGFDYQADVTAPA